MKRHLVWIVAAVVLLAIPAVIGLMVLSGDDRRLGATMETGTALQVRLSIGGTQSVWRSFKWGADLDVAELREGDSTVTTLVAGASKLRPIELERGFVTGGSDAFIEALRGGERFKEASVQVFDQNGSPIARYDLSGVFVASIEHELVAGNPFLERLTLRYADLAFSS